ncbi:MAG: TIGR04283 family arsenosugar biosynthesis glycosyltransferase [Nevskiales bacterium]|nr:TIGR04283 family arsenosugar biosynthesis glycosyltransferase [Nevskiales bacterium]
MTPLSIIIPTLNEAAALPVLLSDLQQQNLRCQIIVADGGSTDGTVALAEQAGVLTVQAPRGRGSQMNAGAQLALGEFLLFLHADTRLPSPTLLQEALDALRSETTAGHPDRLAGHFPLRFVRTRPGHDFLFRYLEEKTALNRRGTINGDQGVLMSAVFFRELGGYDTRLPFLEDQRLAARVWARGRWTVLPGYLTTSARRFEAEGHAQRCTLMALMMALHEAGLHEFFDRAPGVYVSQDKTQRLDLSRFHRLIRQELWRARWRRAAQILFLCGRFVRENAWQLFYYRDVRRRETLGAGRYPALSFYDRRLSRLLDNRLCDGLATLLMCAWFFLWLPFRL